MGLNLDSKYTPHNGKMVSTSSLNPGYVDPKSIQLSGPSTSPNIGQATGNAGIGALSALPTAFSSYTAIDDSSLDAQIASANNVQFSSIDNSNLMAEWDNYNPLQTDYKWKDVGFDWGEQIGNTLSATASGLSAGPWGALAGFAVGLAGNVAAGIKANRQVKEAESEAKRVNMANQNKFINQVNTVDSSNDKLRKMSVLAEGGNLMTPNILTEVNAGGTHEQNPFGGVPMGVDAEGTPNLVEEGEVIYKDYVFSNRIKVPKSLKDKYKIKEDSITFADTVKQLIDPYKETMDDPISKREIESIMSEFTQAQEDIRMKKNIKNKQNKFSPGGWLQYAPMLANTAGLLQNAFTTPDYVYANKIENAVEAPTAIKPTLLTSRYVPQLVDTNYLVNKGKAQAAATRNALLQTASNAGAARSNLLAQDYATQGTLADTYLKGLEANEAKKLQAAQFNLGVEQYNAEALTKAAEYNAIAKRAANQLYLQSLAQAAQMKMAEDQARAQAIGTNLNALADNAYQLYRDGITDKQVAFYNSFSPYLNEEGKALFAQYEKDGGKLNRKKRKGLTY